MIRMTVTLDRGARAGPCHCVRGVKRSAGWRGAIGVRLAGVLFGRTLLKEDLADLITPIG
jgi:hypothetical protein